MCYGDKLWFWLIEYGDDFSFPLVWRRYGKNRKSVPKMQRFKVDFLW